MIEGRRFRLFVVRFAKATARGIYGGLCVFTLDAAVTVHAQDLPVYQLEQNRAALEGSAAAVSQISPVTVAISTSRTPPDNETHGKLDTSGNLLGDIGGLRTWLDNYGVTLSVNEIAELWGNTTGGTKQRPAFNGVLAMTFTADLEKTIGFEDGVFTVSGLLIHGHPISMYSQLGVFNPTSGFEGMRSTRLFELWYQQGFLDNKIDVKIGQMDLDSEFLISQYASLFLNASFGWPLAPSVNLYSGGPSWPLAAPGVRLRYRPSNHWTFMFAATDDNPSGHTFFNSNDPSSQTVHPGGNNFNLNTGALLIGEMQYVTSFWGAKDGKDGLPGLYKLGGYYDTASFPDERYDTRGVSLASPDSNGYPAMRKGNWMLYGIMDQMIWRPDPESPTALGFFARATGNGGDRNLVDVSVDTGFSLKAPLPGRDNDTFGVGYGMGHVSNRASGLSWDNLYYSGSNYPIRGTEHHFELTYQAQLTPWLTLQPDFQYVWNPGGGIPNPNTGYKIGDILIFGLHANVTF